ncbi:MAG: LysM peptidoglycan-binding domain-containing protein, partial [Halanaerobiales bacterium]
LAFTVFHSSGHTTEKYIELKVEDGQTLWAIASKNNPGNKDIRKLVYDIKKLNKLDTVKLHPGDKIKIPVK